MVQVPLPDIILPPPRPIRAHSRAFVANPSCASCPELALLVVSEVYPDFEIGVEGW